MTRTLKRQPTSFDVARRAGVSRSAVSRAFTPGANISDHTRQIVFEAAEALGYRVNSLARGLQGNHSGIVGLLASRLDTPVRARQVKLLSQLLIGEGYRPMLVTAEQPNEVAGVLDSLLGYSVAGVIVTSDTPPQQMIDDCERLGVPVVLINRAETTGWGDRIIIDAEESGELAFEMLSNGKPTSLGVLEPSSETYSVTGRARAFARVAQARSCDCQTIKAPDQSYAGSRETVAAAGRDVFEKLDGLFCATDLMAIGALDALRIDLGLAVPDDLQVVGFDDIEQAGWGAYALSTVRQDLHEQTETAMRLLNARMADHDAPVQTVRIRLQPVYRETTNHVR